MRAAAFFGRVDDLKWLPLLTGCGTQHPHRALDGTCVLLAAAPTTPPCFRRWRRSSSLLAIFSGKIILNFGISERLRAFRYPIFTEGVVEENCLSTVALFPMKKGENAIRSAALSQKAALQMPFAATTPPVKK